MAADNRFFDDLARMAGGAASLLTTMRGQIRSDLKDRAQAYTSKMDLSSRGEVERLQASVSKYRLEQEQMKKRISELEATLGGGKGKTPAKKKPNLKSSKRK